MSIQSTMEGKLKKAFSPERLVVINESHLHAGHHHQGSDHHGTYDGTGETHFRVRIATPQLSGMSRVAQHRAVMTALAVELKTQVHALAIEVMDITPADDLH